MLGAHEGFGAYGGAAAQIKTPLLPLFAARNGVVGVIKVCGLCAAQCGIAPALGYAGGGHTDDFMGDGGDGAL